MRLLPTQVKMSQLVNKTCSQQPLGSLSTSFNNIVFSSSSYKGYFSEKSIQQLDNESELSVCFSMHVVPRYTNFQNNLINSILYERATVHNG